MSTTATLNIRLWALVMAAGWTFASVAGCATAPEDDGPDEVVGHPPAEDDEDYEPAMPPAHPGEHGEVGTDGDDSAVGSRAEPGVITERQLERLQSFGPSIVMEHVEMQPVHDDDEFVGFEIAEASERARHYMEPKLEVGDVITHVNLVRLERPDDYMEAWETLEEAEQLRFDLVREGEPQEVVFEVR